MGKDLNHPMLRTTEIIGVLTILRAIINPFHSDGLSIQVWNCPFCILRAFWSKFL